MNITTPLVAAEPVPTLYRPRHKVRFITATSLFDGHDAAINLIRRLLQATGVEVIHLGHNRSVDEIVTAAIQEGWCKVHAASPTQFLKAGFRI